MKSKSNIVYHSKKYPYISLKIKILESELEEFGMNCLADTGARDYGIIIFDENFDETKIYQTPLRQYIPLASSKYALTGNQYICSVCFGVGEICLSTMIIVKEGIEVKEGIVGREFLDRYIAIFNGLSKEISIYKDE